MASRIEHSNGIRCEAKRFLASGSDTLGGLHGAASCVFSTVVVIFIRIFLRSSDSS